MKPKQMRLYLRDGLHDEVRTVELDHIPMIIVMGDRAFHMISTGTDEDGQLFGMYRYGYTVFLEEKKA
jgi:hypothetical protein